jgi:hypothetical protein
MAANAKANFLIEFLLGVIRDSSVPQFDMLGCSILLTLTCHAPAQ